MNFITILLLWGFNVFKFNSSYVQVGASSFSRTIYTNVVCIGLCCTSCTLYTWADVPCTLQRTSSGCIEDTLLLDPQTGSPRVWCQSERCVDMPLSR